MLVTFTYFSCSWHWTNKHIPPVKPSVCSVQSLGSLNGMKWHWISLWACGRWTSGINRTGKGFCSGNWNGSIHWGVKRERKIPWNPVTPCSWIRICFAGTFLQAPYSPSVLQNQFPSVCFWFFIGNRPCLSGTLPSPQSPKCLQGLLSASGPLQNALHKPRLLRGEANDQIKSVRLDLSPLIHPF